MNILLLSEADSAGEWKAMTGLSSLLLTQKNCRIYAVFSGQPDRRDLALFSRHWREKRTTEKGWVTHYRDMMKGFFRKTRILAQVRKKVKIEMVIISDYRYFIPAVMIFPGVRVYFSFQNFRNRFTVGEMLRNPYAFAKGVHERLAWMFSYRILVPSRKAVTMLKSADWVSLNARKIIILPNLPSKEYLAPSGNELIRKRVRRSLGIPADAFVVLYAGRLVPEKGVFEALESAIYLKERYDNVVFVCAYIRDKMDVHYFAKLQEKARGRISVYWVPDMPPHELAGLMRTSDVGILVSEIDTFSLFLFESALSALPCITLRTGIAGDLYKGILGLIARFRRDIPRLLLQYRKLSVTKRTSIRQAIRKKALKMIDKPSQKRILTVFEP